MIALAVRNIRGNNEPKIAPEILSGSESSKNVPSKKENRADRFRVFFRKKKRPLYLDDSEKKGHSIYNLLPLTSFLSPKFCRKNFFSESPTIVGTQPSLVSDTSRRIMSTKTIQERKRENGRNSATGFFVSDDFLNLKEAKLGDILEGGSSVEKKSSKNSSGNDSLLSREGALEKNSKSLVRRIKRCSISKADRRLGKYPPFWTFISNDSIMNAIHEYSEANHMVEVTLFLCTVIEYQKLCRCCSAHDQYAAFRKVARHFVIENSPHEINVSYKMRQKVKKLMQDEDIFLATLPSLDEKVHIFDCMYREMECLFWTNLYSRQDLHDPNVGAIIKFVRDNAQFSAIEGDWK